MKSFKSNILRGLSLFYNYPADVMILKNCDGSLYWRLYGDFVDLVDIPQFLQWRQFF